MKNQQNHLATWQYIFAYFVLTASISSLALAYLSIKSKEGLKSPIDSYTTSDIFKIPRTVGDAKRIGSLISNYKNDYYYSVFGAYFATYILLQSFCIPGSIVLSILAGYLFPAPLALLIICTCSTLGASTFYILISNRKQTLINLLNKGGGDSKINQFNEYVQAKLTEYKSNLFMIIFTLRATPIFPNWTINLCSPLIGLPLKPFVWGTFTGVAPLSIIHVWTGRILNDLSNDQSLVNWQSVLMTSLVATSIVFLFYLRNIVKT